jgi:acetylglutamate kinase
MEEAIRKAAALIEALPYIQAFQGKVFVIKFGGAAMEDPPTLDCVLDDVVFLQAVGILPVLVHGGGPEISREMKARNIQPKFVHGHRVTDEPTLRIVRDVLANRINAGLLDRFRSLHGEAVAFADPDKGALRARRRRARFEYPDGRVEEMDLGFVGDMIGVDEALFRDALQARRVPVVASLARGENGEVLNVNADAVAGFLAGALQAEKAIFLTDTNGIRTDREDKNSFADTLTKTHIDDLVRRGVIDGGMLPKVEGCLHALDAGVAKTHIIDGRLKHSLLLEIFTDQGVGTQILQ